VLLRHGESTANAEGLFTGILDVPLSARGEREAKAAAEMMNAAGIEPAVMICSSLMRTRQSAVIIEAVLRSPVAKTISDWRLNERNYGGLTGRSKADVMREFGPDQFVLWRRSMNTAPPPMDDELFNRFAGTLPFSALPASALSRTESLATVILRVDAFYREVVRPLLFRGTTVLVIGHGNSLRALCTVLDDLGDDEVERLNLPTGQPLIYSVASRSRPAPRGGRYLDPVRALAAAVTLANEGGT
jgi:2,3-bisphosphoglycerate-dependent phosphoglycerate mutase